MVKRSTYDLTARDLRHNERPKHPPWVPLVLQGFAAFLLGDHLKVQGYQVPVYQLQWQKSNVILLLLLLQYITLADTANTKKKKTCHKNNMYTWLLMTFGHLGHSYASATIPQAKCPKRLILSSSKVPRTLREALFHSWSSQKRDLRNHVPICSKWPHHGGHSCLVNLSKLSTQISAPTSAAWSRHWSRDRWRRTPRSHSCPLANNDGSHGWGFMVAFVGVKGGQPVPFFVTKKGDDMKSWPFFVKGMDVYELMQVKRGG